MCVRKSVQCGVRGAQKFPEDWAEIDTPEEVKGIANVAALWGGGMAGVDVKEKRCDCVGQLTLSKIVIEENQKIKFKNGLEFVSEKF